MRLLTFTAAVLSCGMAHAAFINFDALPSTALLGGTPPASAVLTNDLASDGVIFGRAGFSAGVAVVQNGSAFSPPNGACGLDVAGDIIFACSGDIYFSFVVPSTTTPGVTTSISFVVGDSGGDLDSFIANFFDVNDLLLGSVAVSGLAHQNVFFASPGIARVFIDNVTGTSAGYLLDNLEFATPTAAGVVVPAPAALLLFGLGALALGVARRR